ncbi:MAG: phosphotransferase [Roseiarcus sp.]|jgi:thiamine kinase-like enzyme
MPDHDTDEIFRLPCWSGGVDIEPLHGGITNRNYLVTDRVKGRFVARVGRDVPVHGIMRFNELAAARAAYVAGLSPEVIHASDGVMVSRFIEGRALTPEAVRDPANLPRVVDLVRRCHRDVAAHLRGPSLIFWVFQVVRGYAGVLRERGSRLAPRLSRLLAINDRLEALVGPVTIAFGHNDLLSGNLIDDGARLWLLDWDYAGFNSPLFDLANLVTNNGLNEQEEREVLARYGGLPGESKGAGMAAMKCASLLREYLWGAVSELFSNIDFDYVAYADDYGSRFEAAWKSVEARNDAGLT